MARTAWSSIFCVYLLLSTSSAVTQLSYTTASPAPSSVICNDATGCEITCTGDNSCTGATLNSLSASYLTITATGDSALASATIHCPSSANAQCIITAIGSQALTSSTINCGTNAVCDVTGGDERSLYMTTIDATSSTKLTITADGGYLALSESTINCPQNQAARSCTVRLRSDSSPHWSSSLGGPIMQHVYFSIGSGDDIEFRCDANTNWDALFSTSATIPNEVHIYGDNSALCSIELASYSASDFYGTNVLQCEYKQKGSWINLLSVSRCIPWFTTSPTAEPSSSPTSTTLNPTKKPTISPTKSPTDFPTLSPSKIPTTTPTLSTLPPSKAPTTASPTNKPTSPPTATPSASPSNTPTSPTLSPTSDPTVEPTFSTETPSKSPTIDPTPNPTTSPTSATNDPTSNPTTNPTANPTANPTKSPTNDPTLDPTAEPTTAEPTEYTAFPTLSPSGAPIETTDTVSDKKDGNMMYGFTDNYLIFGIIVAILFIAVCFGVIWLFLCMKNANYAKDGLPFNFSQRSTSTAGQTEVETVPRGPVFSSSAFSDSSFGAKVELPSEKGTMSKHERIISDSVDDDIFLGVLGANVDANEYLDVCTDCTACKMGKQFNGAFYCNPCWAKYAQVKALQQSAMQTAGGQQPALNKVVVCDDDDDLLYVVENVGNNDKMFNDAIVHGDTEIIARQQSALNKVVVGDDDDDDDDDDDSLYDQGVTEQETVAGHVDPFDE